MAYSVLDMFSVDSSKFVKLDFSSSNDGTSETCTLKLRNIEQGANQLYVNVDFINGSLAYATVESYLFSGRYEASQYKPPLKAGTPSDNVSMARSFLQKYRAAFDLAYCDAFASVLDEVSSLSDGMEIWKTSQNFVLYVNMTSTYIDFRWKYTENGMLAFGKSLSISVSTSGYVSAFHDNWKFYTVGSTTVNVSKEQAINESLALAKPYMESVNVGAGQIESLLWLYDPTESGEKQSWILYPCWQIYIEFDPPYTLPSGAAMVAYSVSMRADTNEVLHAHPVGIKGDGGQTPTQTPINFYLFILALAAVFVITGAFIFTRIKKHAK